MNSIIKVENLKKYYGEIKAVDGISLAFEKGMITAVLGPNGAGKSTTIEMLTGLRKPSEGTLYFFGTELQSVNSEIKERIGVQLQNTEFFNFLTVEETLKAFAGLYKRKCSITELMNKFGLTEMRKRNVKSLSGGQKQRLAIACALVNDPEVLFLDEPTNHLDPQSRRNIVDELLNLKASRKTLILSTHQMEEAEKLADYIFIMDYGKVIAHGTVDELTVNRTRSLEDVFLDLTGRTLRD